MPLSLRFALREMRGGLAGFRIFLACLALGVATIAAAGSTAQAFRQGLAGQAREILGGDIAVTVEGRPFSPEQIAAMRRLGAVSFASLNRSMAQTPGGERRLVELRGVDPAYPLAGVVDLDGAPTLAAAFQTVDGLPGAAVEQVLLDKLRLRLGDPFTVGETTLVARAVLLAEPDRLSRGFALGPRVLTSMTTFQANRAKAPGLPVTTTARIALASDAAVRPTSEQLAKTLGRGVRIRDRDDAAPGLSWLIDQLEYFLSFIGLASLLAGGLGVFGAVSAYLQARRPSIAVLKALGASGVLIRNVYLIQIGLLAALGVIIGLAIGAGAPLLLGLWVKDQLPVPALFAIYPGPLAKAAAFGLLSAAAFSLIPLARARHTPPAGLFRHDLGGGVGFGLETVGAAIAAVGLAVLAFATAPTALSAAIMIAGVTASFLVLTALGIGAAKLAGHLRRFSRGPLKLALANLAGPQSAARTAAPAIGLGVALLACVVLIQSSLLRLVADVAPRSAPAVVYTDVPGDRTAEFDALLTRAYGARLTADDYLREPVVSGRITRVRGEPVVRSAMRAQGRWAYDNDIQMSVIGPQPRNAGIVQGAWWPRDYAGPPLVAMEEDAAAAASLKIGDTITVSVLGRDLDARVAVLRKVEMGGFGANFAVVLNPSALEGAVLRNVAIAKVGREGEAAATRALGVSFPEVNVISVREQLEAAKDIFDQVSLAVRAAAGVAGLAGVFVLAGAIAARAQARTREAATLKVLGASRAQILSAYVLEYGAIGLIAGLAGVGLGYLAAWPVVAKVFQAQWSVDWAGVAALITAAAVLTGLGGLIAALHTLAQRPAAALRSP